MFTDGPGLSEPVSQTRRSPTQWLMQTADLKKRETKKREKAELLNTAEGN